MWKMGVLSLVCLGSVPALPYPHPLDACAGNLLAVIQLEAFQAAAVLQVLQGHVSDEEAIVQFQYPQPLVTAGAVAQVQDPIICDELTVGQTLEQGDTHGYLRDLLFPRLRAWAEQHPIVATYDRRIKHKILGSCGHGFAAALGGCSHLSNYVKMEIKLQVMIQLKRTM